jgi:DNA mismatch repair protein MutS
MTQDPSLREALDVPSGEPLLDTCANLCDLLERALEDDPPVKLADGGVIRSGFDAELDEARLLARDGQRVMVELEGRMRESSGIASLKVRYTRVFGWYMEVTRTHVDRAPGSWRRKQTIAAGERFTCEELDTLADKLAHAEDRFAVREGALFASLVRELAAGSERFRRTAERLASWDVAAALAEVAHRDDFARPEVDDSLTLSVEDGRHPTVEKLAAAGHFVPNDVWLDAASPPEDGKGRLWLVTGPNMAGKSTYIRQVALIVLMAQVGSWVPASSCRFGRVDRIFSRVGASDDLARGNSTFMVEMNETANILNNATDRSLIILDEIGRGTSTYDGLSIAWAVMEHLHRDPSRGPRTLFATHYQELTQLDKHLPRMRNLSVAVKEWNEEIVFVRRVVPGAADRSYGIQVARLAGLPPSVIDRAKEILSRLEGDDSTVTLPSPQARPKKKISVASADAGQLDLL